MGFWAHALGLDARDGSTGSAGGDSPLSGIVPPARDARGPVSVERALSLPAVFRSVQILATSVAQLGLGVWRGAEQLDPAPLLIRQPDPQRTYSAFIKRTVISLATQGNAFWQVYRDERGNIQGVRALNPLGVRIRYDRRGRKWWDYATTERGRAVSRSFRESEVEHLRMLEVPGLDLGLGPIQAARVTLGGALDLREYAAGWFTTGDVPTGVLTTTQQLTKADADAYKQRWGEDPYGLRVLGQGLTYEPIMLKPEDAQWIEAQKFGVTDIARMFGVPANYLLAEVDGTSMTYSNLEQVDTQLVRTTLLAYMVEIEDALSGLLPRGQAAKFKAEQFMRADTKTRAEVNAIYAGLNVLSPEEIRISEGYGPGAPAGAPSPTTTETPA